MVSFHHSLKGGKSRQFLTRRSAGNIGLKGKLPMFSLKTLVNFTCTRTTSWMTGPIAGLALALASPAMAQSPSDQAPAPSPVEAQAQAGSPVATSYSQYRVRAGDELDVFVWGEERMQRVIRVQPDGTFAFPLAGTIRASGRATSDIAAELRERIAVNFRSTAPDVTVSVRTATDMRFYVVGKVRSPGSFTSGTPINLLQALSMAGGLAEFADVKNAVVLRQTSRGQAVERVALNHVLKGGRVLDAGTLATALPTLSSGDVLVVP